MRLPSIEAVITPDERTLIEIAENAARAGVVLVERGGSIALCGKDNIPPGWHRVGVSVIERTALA